MPLKSLLQTISILMLSSVALSACGAPVKDVQYAPSPDIPETATPTPIKYSGIELLLPPGMNIGTQQGGYFCISPAEPVNRNVLSKAIDKKFLRQTFHDAMEANGYDVVGSLDVLFEPDDEDQRAEYSIKGKLKDAQVNMCDHQKGRVDWLSGWAGQRGEMYLAFDWSVYDQLRRTVVFKTSSEGSTERRTPNTEGLTLLFHDAFEMAVHNLAANEDFKKLIVEGKKPAHSGLARDVRGEKIDQRPRKFDPDEEVTLGNKPLSRQPFAKTAETGRNVSVMIHKGKHASGFFITKEGHILTSASAVGEDIYAIGVPRDWKRYRGSLTKGIVSSHRKDMKFQGLRNNYIQGDVKIHPGSAGGALLDEYGNIVGLASSDSNTFGVEDSARIGTGLNLFVPIQEALDRLNIAY